MKHKHQFYSFLKKNLCSISGSWVPNTNIMINSMLCWMKQHAFNTRKGLFPPHCSKSQMKKHWKDILSGQLMWRLALQTLSWHSSWAVSVMNYWCSLPFLRFFYVMMLTWNASSFAEGSKFFGQNVPHQLQFFTTSRASFLSFQVFIDRLCPLWSQRKNSLLTKAPGFNDLKGELKNAALY